MQPAQTRLGKHDAAGASVARILFPPHDAPSLALIHQCRHGLLAHAGGLGQLGQAAALQRQMPRDVDVGRTHLLARSQVGQCQRHLRIMRHEFQHAGIEAAHGFTQQPPQMRAAPVIACCCHCRSFLRCPPSTFPAASPEPCPTPVYKALALPLKQSLYEGFHFSHAN